MSPWTTTTTPRPARTPANDTVPASAACTACPGDAEQVDPAVAGAPGRVRWVEPGDDLRRGLERPDPDGHRVRGGRGGRDREHDGQPPAARSARRAASRRLRERMPGSSAVPGTGRPPRRRACGGGCPERSPVDEQPGPAPLDSRGSGPRRTLDAAAPPGADFARPQTTTAPMFPGAPSRSWARLLGPGRKRSGRILAQASGRPAPAGREELKTTGERSRPALTSRAG